MRPNKREAPMPVAGSALRCRLFADASSHPIRIPPLIGIDCPVMPSDSLLAR